MALARAQHPSARLQVLQFLTKVDAPANRDWLLQVGYDNGLTYAPCAYFAVVHGRLIEKLRAQHIERSDLTHYVRAMDLLCANVGEQPLMSKWWTMLDYRDGPEAIRRLMHRVWPPAVARELADLLRRLIVEAHGDTGLFWWEQAPATLDDLRAGRIDTLAEVLSNAAAGDSFTEVVEWAVGYLPLERAALESDLPHLRPTAAALLANRTREAMPADLQDIARKAWLRTPQEEKLAMLAQRWGFEESPTP